MLGPTWELTPNGLIVAMPEATIAFAAEAVMGTVAIKVVSIIKHTHIDETNLCLILSLVFIKISLSLILY